LTSLHSSHLMLLHVIKVPPLTWELIILMPHGLN
jgi:hypothetical protein